MFIRFFLLANSLLFVLINAQNNNQIKSGINIHVVEGEPSKSVADDPDNQLWQTTTERTLIRVTRLQTKTEQPKAEKRSRRQIIEAIQTAGVVISVAKAMRNTESGEEILGMAKKVAIAVIVIVSLCIACCLITTVVVCVKCCSNGNDRKRSRGPSNAQVPQPIFVHTSPAGYQPHYHQQQAPPTWGPTVVQNSEFSPMLPQPSAPPRPQDHFHVEHPPPSYEKLYTSKQ